MEASMTSSANSTALTRYGGRSLARYNRQAREVAGVSQEAFRAAREVARMARDQVLRELSWTDQELARLQRQGRLTPNLEEDILDELDRYMYQIGWITGDAYVKLRRALASLPEAKPLSRLDVAVDAYFLLADGS
jgi:hypothetical protein